MGFQWTAFVQKTWSKGLKTALQEEIVSKTTNTFDDIALNMIDLAITNVVGHFEKKKLEKIT